MSKYQRAFCRIDSTILFERDEELLQHYADSFYKYDSHLMLEIVRKATPQKPKPSGYKPSWLDKFLFGSQETYVCPTCFNQCLVRIAPNGRNENSYCYNCGQKLDWS